MKNKSCSIFNIDYLTPRPHLLIFGQKRLTNPVGLILSVLIFLASIGFAIYALIDYFDRDEINVLYSQRKPNDSHEFNITENLFAFTYSAGGVDISQEVIMYGFYVNKVESEVVGTQIQFQPCEVGVTIPERFASYFPLETAKNYYCVAPNQNITIKTDADKEIVKYLSIYLAPCDATRFSFCKPNQEVYTNLQKRQIRFTYFIENNIIDHANKTNMFNSFISTYTKYLSFSTLHAQMGFWSIIDYETDNGYMFDKRKNYRVVTFDDKNTINYEMPKITSFFSVPLGIFEFSISHDYIESYFRSYKKIQNVLGDICGVLLILKIIGELIIHTFITNLYFTKLAQNIFNDNHVYKYNNNNLYNKTINNNDDIRHIKLTNNSSINNPTTEPSNNQLVSIEKNHNLVQTIPFAKKDDMNLLKNFNINKIYKDTPGDTQRSHIGQVGFWGFFVNTIPFIRNKNKDVINSMVNLITTSLSCDEVIKNRINLLKMINIFEQSNKFQLNQMKPFFYHEFEPNNKTVNDSS